ncbi:hypothetical protein BC936DRAFT_140254 [Jimgerdemannia flammicorona]|uniref:Yeast cell wall synthesis Kre9/Knh1-like N-terminal domain-containing protein n=1 Tax=Jimgerdemannia flammicorona TaxID=994334 RepID=A0A433AVR7_9FUNG|nr:hypothetical protein BC936DRAFT_140254 [Jimgerdemannia flammicorona]
MKFTAVLAVLVTLAASVCAQSSAAITDYIYITSPVGATVCNAGKACAFTWKFTAGAGAPSMIQIDLLNNGVLDSSIITGIKPTDQKYTWTVPATQASSYYYSIRLYDATTGYQSYSHIFTVKGVGALSSIAPVSSASAGSSNAYSYVAPTTAGPSSNGFVLPSSTSSTTKPTAATNTTSAPTAKASNGAGKVGSNALAALSVFVIAIVVLASRATVLIRAIIKALTRIKFSSSVWLFASFGDRRYSMTENCAVASQSMYKNVT